MALEANAGMNGRRPLQAQKRVDCCTFTVNSFAVATLGSWLSISFRSEFLT